MDVSGSYGQLRLLRSLGVTDLCEVFLGQRADAEGMEGLVVVKRVLPEAGSSPAFVQAFLDEAGLTGRLRHPNVVKVYDLGEYDGASFVATEYVPGGTIAELLDRRKGSGLSLGDALHVVARICETLEHLQAAPGPDGEPLRAVHGDLKPENVLLSIDGEVRLADFGMGRARAALGLAPPGPQRPYLAPEQAAGQPADARSDVFACGALLSLLATGHAPTAPQPASRGIWDLGPTLSADLEGVIGRAMAPEPADRYPSHAAMLAAIARAAASLGVRGDRTSLTRIVRAAFPVLGGTAQVVDAVSSAPPPSYSPARREQPPEPERPELRAATPAPLAPAPVLSEPSPSGGPAATPVQRSAPSVPAAPAPVVDVEATARSRSPARARPAGGPRSGLLLGLAIAAGLLALAAVGAATVAVVIVRQGSAPPAPTAWATAPPATPSGAGPQQGWAAAPMPGPAPAPPPPAPVEPATTAPAGVSPVAAPQPGAGTAHEPPLPQVGSPDAGSPGSPAGGTPGADAPPARTRPPGHLTVLTRPFSRVYLDGRLLGTTPILRREVPSGRHTLRLVADRLPPRQLRIEVGPGRLTQVNQSLTSP